MSAKSEGNSGLGLCGVTFIVFLILKLTDNIDWSWWWVTAPLWIPAGFTLALLLVAGIAIGIKKLVSG